MRRLMIYALLLQSASAYSADDIRDPFHDCKKVVETNDYYLKNLPVRPKEEIAAYVESQGILVPKRFASLQEALDSGKLFIIRSEFAREYFEAAGLFYSPTFDAWYQKKYEESNFVNEEPFTEFLEALQTYKKTGSSEEFVKILRQPDRRIRIYSDLMRFNVDDVLQNTDYSYWELLGGVNRSMIEDSAVRGRYHLFTSYRNERGHQMNSYIIFEEGKVIQHSLKELDPQKLAELPRLIAFYEKIRTLPRFDPNHCPVIEFQTLDEKDYFLQYHRTRDRSLATFKLKRKRLKNEVRALYVRGVTPPEGRELDLSINVYLDQAPGSGRVALPPNEARYNSFQKSYPTYLELMSRKVSAVFSECNFDRITSAGSGQDPHLLKSEIYIGIDLTALIPDFEVRRRALPDFHKFTVKVRVVSDGTRAYVSLIND